MLEDGPDNMPQADPTEPTSSERKGGRDKTK